MGASISNTRGFTLVEISIVMIIIGLLIGGTFGGMKLVENMQVNRTVQDLKSIESAALTFKDAYGRLPGDIPNPSTRLPNCTAAPCATGGNGNRRIDYSSALEALTATMEKFTIWHHLQSADLLSMSVQNTVDMSFGEGQPDSPLGVGYRFLSYNGALFVTGSTDFRGAGLMGTPTDSAALTGAPDRITPCGKIQAVDNKMDDGQPFIGLVQAWGCGATTALSDTYMVAQRGAFYYDLKGF